MTKRYVSHIVWQAHLVTGSFLEAQAVGHSNVARKLAGKEKDCDTVTTQVAVADCDKCPPAFGGKGRRHWTVATRTANRDVVYGALKSCWHGSSRAGDQTQFAEVLSRVNEAKEIKELIFNINRGERQTPAKCFYGSVLASKVQCRKPICWEKRASLNI